MKNSPSHIDGIPLESVVTVRREYYPANPRACPLCKLRQPPVEVHNENDFARVLDTQLTPFDFWELVTDSKALTQETLDPQDRRLSFRVDTRKLVVRYGRWLENVIRHKAHRRWPNTRPHVICTVQEDSGVEFARLVARALKVDRIISIPRSALRRVTPASLPLPDLATCVTTGADQILVVDDGINYGGTIVALVTACRVSGATIFGALVLDSRLDSRGTERLREQMGGAALLPLYSWPASSNTL